MHLTVNGENYTLRIFLENFFLFQECKDVKRILNCFFELEWEQIISSVTVGIPDSALEMCYAMLFQFFIQNLKVALSCLKKIR